MSHLMTANECSVLILSRQKIEEEVEKLADQLQEIKSLLLK